MVFSSLELSNPCSWQHSTLGSHSAFSEDCPLRAPSHTSLYPARLGSRTPARRPKILTTLSLVGAIGAVHPVVTLWVLSAHALTVLTGEGIPGALAWKKRTKLGPGTSTV